ncbi:GIY-YIG nuclease family protein [Micromonospora sp. MED01]|uniref:GIY-YIG nuclease family protein n=1 Tax=Micromonospora alfalfae TaxID=2911212 RepID=UPI001EE7DD92|nr:GIY-YIG nuclease family protein [Micromonospora alfalfae]MCG5464314.1 GIY-YIG nuclease family protein [Micromonospora alfalfae]
MNRHSGPVVYYARCGEQIKIGYTTREPAKRLTDIQRALNLPLQLLAIEPGGRELEQQRHEQFAPYRTYGEWFVVADSIVRHAGSLARTHPVPAYESRVMYRAQRRAGIGQKKLQAGLPPEYVVQATRQGRHWSADVPSLEGTHTFARNLPALDKSVRECIALTRDLPVGAEADLRIDYEYDTGDEQLNERTAWLRADRERVRREREVAAAATADLALRMVSELGLSVRDAAVLLDVSPQRISQVAPRASKLKRRATA